MDKELQVLDLVVKFDTTFEIEPVRRGLDVRTGTKKEFKKQYMPPFIDSESVCATTMRSIANSMIARWSQIPCSMSTLCTCVKHEMWLWQQYGWNIQYFMKFFAHSASFPQISTTVRHVAKQQRMELATKEKKSAMAAHRGTAERYLAVHHMQR